MTITTGSFTKLLWPGLNAIYNKSHQSWKEEYSQVFDVYKSKKAWEEDLGVTGLGLLARRGEGAPIQYDTEHQGFLTRYTHAEFAGGFKITRNAMEDDQYGVVGERGAKRLARSEKETRETVSWLVVNRAFNSSFVGGDGKELLATDHPNAGGAGGTYANELATSADISEAAMEQVCIDLGKYTDDRGLRIPVKPLKIIVPVDLDFEVNKIMKTEYEVGTANNTVNIVRSRFPGGVMVSHYLTDTDAWFVKTDQDNGLKFFERRAPAFETDNDWDTDNAKYKVSTRYSVGFTNPKALFGSPGA
jgi:hypothetical protein